jgi:hypothetical protein
VFRIYYSDRVADGFSADDWIALPDDDVQVVAVFEPPSNPLPDRLITGYVGCGLKDRMLFTGVDTFELFGHTKRGRLLSDEQYFAIWEKAYGDANA